jgi:S-adenosylmethionine-diacylgycerolhomoserine-N-methlytransferase
VSAASGEHAALMDSIYRGQRHIYDATRKYYLFGRDRLIDRLACRPGDSVLEIACGTGRNLDRIARSWPGVHLFGLDISNEMLISASGRLGTRARLAQGDARDFDAATALGQERFDRVVLSYSLSMIPDWERALRHAASLVAPGGSLHLVDFGSLEGLPRPLAAALRGWLAKFHVEPSLDLRDAALRVCALEALDCEWEAGPFTYYQSGVLQRPTG